MRAARRHGGTGLVSLVSTLACGVFCLAASLALGERFWPQTMAQWAMMAGLGVGCHAIGQGLSAYAVGSLGASTTAVVLVYGVLVTALGGWLVFGEAPGALQIAGGALVLAAVIICRPR
jgi:drug/metabolite transporter (DMT)-like permease